MLQYLDSMKGNLERRVGWDYIKVKDPQLIRMSGKWLTEAIVESLDTELAWEDPEKQRLTFSAEYCDFIYII